MLRSFTKYQVKIISALELKAEYWTDDAALLIIGGGADIYYTRKLNGQGNTVIKRYIDNGGKYLGICAGAYYACNAIEFAVRTKLELIGDRELKLFNGKAIGPLFNKYSYQDNSGATPAIVQVNRIGTLPIFFNGGCYFSNGDCKVIAHYSELNLPAIISVKNDHVILSGVHFEYDPVTMDYSDIYLSKVAKVLLPAEILRQTLVCHIFHLLQL